MNCSVGNGPPLWLLPTEVDEACDAMATLDRHQVVAGGTDVMVAVNAGRVDPSGWIGLCRIDELNEHRIGTVDAVLGAGVTWRQLEQQGMLSALAEAARGVGSPQIRTAASIGGNVVTASPAGDGLPVLLCHDAEVELASSQARRRVPLEQFLVGPKRTTKAAGELLVAIHLRDVRGAQSFMKVGPRQAMVIAQVSLAARLDPERAVARVAIGAAAPTARRAHDAESALLAGDDREAFAHEVVAAASPIDDVRASASYRRHALGVLARRTFDRLWAELR